MLSLPPSPLLLSSFESSVLPPFTVLLLPINQFQSLLLLADEKQATTFWGTPCTCIRDTEVKRREEYHEITMAPASLSRRCEKPIDINQSTITVPPAVLILPSFSFLHLFHGQLLIICFRSPPLSHHHHHRLPVWLSSSRRPHRYLYEFSNLLVTSFSMRVFNNGNFGATFRERIHSALSECHLGCLFDLSYQQAFDSSIGWEPAKQKQLKIRRLRSFMRSSLLLSASFSLTDQMYQSCFKGIGPLTHEQDRTTVP